MDLLGNPSNVHTRLLLIRIEVDPVTGKDDFGIDLRPGEARNRCDTTSRSGLVNGVNRKVP